MGTGQADPWQLRSGGGPRWSGRLVHEMMGVRQLVRVALTDALVAGVRTRLTRVPHFGVDGQAVRPTAIFSWDEQHVLSTDEATNAVVVWDVRTRSLQHRLTGKRPPYASWQRGGGAGGRAGGCFLLRALSLVPIPLTCVRLSRAHETQGILDTCGRWRRCQTTTRSRAEGTGKTCAHSKNQA